MKLFGELKVHAMCHKHAPPTPPPSRTPNPLAFGVAHGRKGSSCSPPAHAFGFYRALDSELPQLGEFHRSLRTHALILFAVEDGNK